MVVLGEDLGGMESFVMGDSVRVFNGRTFEPREIVQKLEFAIYKDEDGQLRVHGQTEGTLNTTEVIILVLSFLASVLAMLQVKS